MDIFVERWDIKMKVLAMYLPQFHRIKENDEWWGEGFTEWTTVKHAKPLFEGHIQPHVPQNNNYYNLLDKETMQWQASLMKKYGIDGMCMYHYWFKDGRQILEKPAENLLQWKDIDMPFCFCWANETWARTWSSLSNVNVWASTLEQKTVDGKSILLEQKYGEEKEWTIHFEYLLDFFKDDRYIKVDNKPVFMIYRPELMPCVERMLLLWNKLAKETGFAGLYLIGGDRGEYSGIHDVAFDRMISWEPIYSISSLDAQGYAKKIENALVLEYDDIWNCILGRKMNIAKRIFGGVVDYDDTPRRGAQGMLLQGASSEKFAKYFTELLAKNASVGNEFVFVNAWNEWGEGMYLEPDADNRYAYLEAIDYAKRNYNKYIEKYIKLHESKVNRVSTEARNRHYFTIFEKWIDFQYKGLRLQDYFLNKGYSSIAVYGYGSLAKLVETELKGTPVKIEYVIDKNKEKIDCNFPVFDLEDDLSPVDVVVITATFSTGAIFTDLWKHGYRNIISFEEIITELA